METTIRIERGYYGEIITVFGGVTAPASYLRAKDIFASAIKKNLIAKPYVYVDSKHRGSALNYDIYDFAPGIVLIQQRNTTCSKYGNSVTKNYWFLKRKNGIITKENIDCHKSRIVKLAKSELPFGGVIAAITGKKPAKIKVAAQNKYTAFKQVAVIDGKYYSIFDGITEYRIGKTTIDKAEDNHKGGIYVYFDIDSAKNASVPDDSKLIASPRAVLKCEVSGRNIRYDNGKNAFTKVTPISVM